MTLGHPAVWRPKDMRTEGSWRPVLILAGARPLSPPRSPRGRGAQPLSLPLPCRASCGRPKLGQWGREARPGEGLPRGRRARVPPRA